MEQGQGLSRRWALVSSVLTRFCYTWFSEMVMKLASQVRNFLISQSEQTIESTYGAYLKAVQEANYWSSLQGHAKIHVHVEV